MNTQTAQPMTDKELHGEVLSIVAIMNDIDTMRGDIRDRINDIATKADIKPALVRGLVARMYKNDMQEVSNNISELEALFERIIRA